MYLPARRGQSVISSRFSSLRCSELPLKLADPVEDHRMVALGIDDDELVVYPHHDLRALSWPQNLLRGEAGWGVIGLKPLNPTMSS